MAYTKIFEKPYADGYKNRPDTTTPITAEIKNKETETLLAIEAYLAALQIPKKLSELTNDEGFIKNTVSNLANYYLKSETYTQAEVQALIAAAVSSVAGKLNMEVVDSLPAEGISTTTFYLLPKETAEEKNAYDEYINTDGTTSGWELIGGISTSIDLSNYYSKSETAALVAEKTTQIADDINKHLSQLEIDLKMLGYTVPKEMPVQNYVDENGVFHQRVGRVDMGTLDYTANDGIMTAMVDMIIKSTNNAKIGNIYSNHFTSVAYTDLMNKTTDKSISLRDSNVYIPAGISIYDSSFSDAAIFKKAMSGVYLYYELGTEIWTDVDGNEAVVSMQSDIDSVQAQADNNASCLTVNLLNPSHLGTTVMGITCTNNGDGTYALNGTATADLDLCIKGFKNLQLNKEYKMLGCPSGGSDSTYMLYDSSESDIKDIGKGKVYTPTKQPNINIRIMNGVTVNNLVFKPMLTTNLSATYDDFVPYTGDTGKLNGDVAMLMKHLPEAGGNVTIDTELSETSENPVQNKVITAKLNEVFQSVSDGKAAIADAITDRGIETSAEASFSIMAANIAAIPTGLSYEVIDGPIIAEYTLL